MSAGETIFALSSGQPPAGIAIIRISGPEAGTALERLSGTLPRPRFAQLCSLKDPQSGTLLDNALCLWFPGPNSVTGEHLAELHLHGGRAVVRAVEAALEQLSGLRRAEAGEFTRRAYVNGRMDLSEAEGLSDLLAAETELQRRAAVNMANGGFSEQIELWREETLRLSALVEADLDFSDEDDVDDTNLRTIIEGAKNLAETVGAVLRRPSAEKLRDGIKVVLGGPPNSGKSTLLNALTQRDAAIVSDIAGTTRDIIEVPISLDGVPFLFLDTAGLRGDGAEEIEQIGIERAQRAFDNADILLWLGRGGEGPEHKNLVEIDARSDDENRERKDQPLISLSAKTGENIDTLIEYLVSAARELLPPPGELAVNQRQRAHLADIVELLNALSSNQQSDMLILGEQLRLVRLSLDALTGRAHTEDMLDALFGRFCIGK